MLNQAKEQVTRRPAEAERLATKILESYADTDNSEIALYARAIRAQALTRLGKVAEGLALAREGLEAANNINVNSEILAELYFAMGAGEQALGSLPDAFLYYRHAHGIWVNLKNEKNATALLMSMAGLYTESGDIDRAISNYERLLPIVKQSEDLFAQARATNNLAYAYTQQKQYTRALELLEDSRRLAELNNNPLAKAYAYENTGNALLKNGQIDEAEYYLNYALNLTRELGLNALAASAYVNLGWVEFYRNNIDKSLENTLNGFDFASNSGDKPTIKDAHFLLARLYRSKGAYDKALNEYEMYIAYQDQISDDTTSRRLGILEAEFQLTEKENQIKLLKRDSEISELRLEQTETFKNSAITGAVMLLGIIAILIFLLRSMSLANRRAAQKTRELLATQSQLRKASKVKSDILAMTSHEIRTPLNAIMGMSQVLQNTPLNAEQQSFAKTIHSSGEMLIATLNDILDLSKIEAGRLDINKETFYTHELATRLNQLWRIKAEEKGLSFIIDESQAPTQQLRGDAHRIQQIVFNLVSNAIKFTQMGSVEVRFTGELKSESVMSLSIIVMDHGIGIPADRLEQIFEPFHQVDSGTARSFGGTGLGLAICRQLARLMGGMVHAESAVNEGSVFTLKLDVEVTEAVEETTLEGGVEMASLAHLNFKPHILVAEDNHLNQMVLKQLMKNIPVTLSFADNGQEAVFALEDQHFDIILMDLHMPIMDGFEAVKAIKARNDAISDIPIIALTADAMAEDRQKVLDAGMSDYVSKPIDMSQLLAALKRHIKNRPASQILASA